MLTLLPSSTIFIITLISGSLICISRPQWLFAWIGLEINLLSFVPLILQRQAHQETEAAIKYFLTQALGSGILLLGRLTLKLTTSSQSPQYYAPTLLICALLLKMGAAPFHYWFPGVISILSWPLCILLTTWQKVAPLLLFTLITPFSLSWLPLFAIIGAIIGGLGGINQSQLRPLIAYSSIGHIAWILAALWINQFIVTRYLIIYITISIALILILWTSSLTLRNVSNINQLSLLSIVVVLILFFSLGGLPPFLGFLPKWIVLQQVISNWALGLAIILIMGALINLFYYLTIGIYLFLRSRWQLHPTQQARPNLRVLITAASALLGLSPSLIIFIYALAFLYQSQRYWHYIFYFRHLIGAFRNLNKSPNSCRTWTTWSSPREGPALQYHCNRSCFPNDFLSSNTCHNWRVW
mgnify:CR=1 FL=1